MSRPLVVGLGSHHGDDQAGWLVIDRLLDRGYPSDQLIRVRHPADLLDALDARQTLVVCDACVGSGSPGTIRRWQWPTEQIVYARPTGSHDLSLGDVLELGRSVQVCPDTAEVWTVEGSNWSPGASVSAKIEAAANDVAAAIWRNIRDA